MITMRSSVTVVTLTACFTLALSKCTNNCYFLVQNFDGNLTDTASINVPSPKVLHPATITIVTKQDTASTVEFYKDDSLSPLYFEYQTSGKPSVYAKKNGNSIGKESFTLLSLSSRSLTEISTKFGNNVKGYIGINNKQYRYGYSPTETEFLQLQKILDVRLVKLTNAQNIVYIRVCNTIKPKLCSIKMTPDPPQPKQPLRIRCTASGSVKPLTMGWHQAKSKLFSDVEEAFDGYPVGVDTANETDPEYTTVSELVIPKFGRGYTGLYKCYNYGNDQYLYQTESRTKEVEMLTEQAENGEKTYKIVGYWSKLSKITTKCTGKIKATNDGNLVPFYCFDDVGIPDKWHALDCSHFSQEVKLSGGKIGAGNETCATSVGGQERFKVSVIATDGEGGAVSIPVIVGIAAGCFVLVLLSILLALILIKVYRKRKRKDRMQKAQASRPTLVIANVGALSPPPPGITIHKKSAL